VLEGGILGSIRVVQAGTGLRLEYKLGFPQRSHNTGAFHPDMSGSSKDKMFSQNVSDQF